MSREAANEAFYRALLDDDPEKLYEQAPCGYLSTTPDGSIVKVNTTFLTWTGYSREDLVGVRSFVDLLTPGGRIYHETHYAPMLRMQGTVREIALEIVASDGRRLPVLLNAALGRDPDGNPVAVRVAVFDASERREYERELLRTKQRAEVSEARATALARTLQQTLIPPALPAIPDLEVAAVYRPAGTGAEVGGDFYDVFQIGTGDWVVALGDVCGKGAEAAVVTALARYTLRAIAVRVSDPSQMLHELNDAVLRHDTERYCTVALLRLRQSNDGWTVTMSLGGHPSPLLVRAGHPPTGWGEPGSLVGVFESATYADSALRLDHGDALLLYTDGVTEGRRGNEFFGEDRLRLSVTAHAGSATSLTDGVVADVLEFQNGMPRDDIALVALRVPTAAVPLTASRERYSPTS
ncbi:MAG TPA: SpoIIE family protein phosphatase [Nocardioidaceae bacterium]|nr:SpoIIE family protein phosphatase [Nocardioidaceae bacterium]